MIKSRNTKSTECRPWEPPVCNWGVFLSFWIIPNAYLTLQYSFRWYTWKLRLPIVSEINDKITKIDFFMKTLKMLPRHVVIILEMSYIRPESSEINLHAQFLIWIVSEMKRKSKKITFWHFQLVFVGMCWAFRCLYIRCPTAAWIR